MSDKWESKFNALPIEIRTIGSAMEAKVRIQQLKIEKDRLKRMYLKSCKEINSHIKNCEKWLLELDREEQGE